MDNSVTNKNAGLIFLGIFLASGIAAAGYFVGQTMYNAKVALNTAEVKGLAERRVQADRANWTVQFTVDREEERGYSGVISNF